MFSRRETSEQPPKTNDEAAPTEGTDAPTEGNGGGAGDPPPPPPEAPTEPVVALPEAGVSMVKFVGPRDKKTKRFPKVVTAVVVAADGLTCTLKLLDRKDSPRVEGIRYSATPPEDGAARWSW